MMIYIMTMKIHNDNGDQLIYRRSLHICNIQAAYDFTNKYIGFYLLYMYSKLKQHICTCVLYVLYIYI